METVEIVEPVEINIVKQITENFFCDICAKSYNTKKKFRDRPGH